MFDTALVRALQKAAVGKGDRSQALGRSRGGPTTKVHMLADGLGRPLRFVLTPGQASDAPQAAALLVGFSARAVLADIAYDSNALRQLIADAGALAVIPDDKTAYCQRNPIARCSNKLEHFRCFVNRCDRRGAHFLAFTHIAAAMIWTR